MQCSAYGTATASPCPREADLAWSGRQSRIPAAGGQTKSRMFLREARERQQEAELEEQLNEIESRMQQCQSEKKLKLRVRSDMVRAKNMQHQNRLE